VGGGAVNAPLGGEGKGRRRPGRRQGAVAGRGQGGRGGSGRLKRGLTGGSHLLAGGREGEGRWAGGCLLGRKEGGPREGERRGGSWNGWMTPSEGITDGLL
jgi:hypothetical protein